MVDAPTTEQREHLLSGRRVALAGKLASMSRRNADRLIRDHGGVLVETIDARSDLIVVSDEVTDVARLATDAEWLTDDLRSAWQQGQLELVRESEFWSRLGLVDAGEGVARLYTPAMLAELLRVPVEAVRRWHRKGHLCATREVSRLPYFDFEEVRIARKLADLLAAGCSGSLIDRKLAELARLCPHLSRPLADAALVVEDRGLYIRRGENLSEPSGQLLIDFEAPPEPGARDEEAAPAAVSIVAAGADEEPTLLHPEATASQSVEDLRLLAADLEERGRRYEAIEVYRAILMSGEFTAEDHFFLAEVLYRAGDLAAARERYYVAIELDEDYVEARANLGCVLAEQGELPLAEAAFRGALAYHPDYADAHFHLARLLDRMQQTHEAANHWRRFLDLAPASPWANEARDRVAGTPSR
jgi:tetratricopeptide (TPR) repeat protein